MQFPLKKAAVATVAAVLFLAALGESPIPRRASQIVTDVLQLLMCAAAGIALARAAFESRELERWFWGLVTTFVFGWTLGQVFWTVHLQGLSSWGVLAPSDFLFLASSAPLLLAFVVRPDRPRQGALGFVFDVGLVTVFALHTYVYFSLGYLVGDETHRYYEWLNDLGNLDSGVILVAAFWAHRTATGLWRERYRFLAVVMLMLHGGSTISSHSVLVGEYHPGLLDLPWVLPFLWLAILGFSFRPIGRVEAPEPASDFRDTRRGLVLAILVVVAVPALHLAVELSLGPDPLLSRMRNSLTLLTALVLGALFLARGLALLRQTERLHLEKQENLKRLFDGSPLAQFLCEPSELRILEVNRAAEIAYELSRTDFVGMKLGDLHPAAEREGLEHSMQEAASPRAGGRLPGDWHHAAGAREPHAVEITARVIDFGPREVMLIVVVDVSERRNLEERLRDSQKMEALGRLAGGVAHDFNNILTAILGYSSLLGAKLGAGHSLAFVREIERSGERAANLTRQLLAFSRKQVLVPQVLDLGTVVSELEMMLRTAVGEDVELSLSIPEALEPIKADRGQIEQVILNLTVNARDAMPGGGTIEIALGRDPNRAGGVVLSVRDTGIGMDELTRSRIFEPFFTTKAPGKGTGLGLATVYGIVAQSGGTIEVESTPGAGTRFVVWLPFCREPMETQPPAEEGPDFSGSATILLVEDEEAVRQMTGRILEEQGYRVLAASSATDALALAERHRELDLVLTDVVMPGMRGPELVSRLLAARSGLKVLYVSGYAADNLGLGGVLDPDTPFLAKPFTAAVLARRVREVLSAVTRSA
jgi:signal transduction histidine kinase